jgi:anthraniloyl-CoA monooxygenase
VCAQLGHAGRKGATCLPWDGGVDQPLPSGGWPIIAPSALPYLPHGQLPREATRQDIENVTADFAAAARNADRAGFDMVELHFAHGYLLSSFISPHTNRRGDEFGGSIENRMRFPLMVVEAVRKVWPASKPLSVRISATDWVEGGLSEADRLAVARLLKQAGIDIINVSTGQVAHDDDPVYGRMYQAPFADQIRNEVGIPTIVAGNITTADQCNTLVAAGRTDLVALARPLLADPHFLLRAAARYGHEAQSWPRQYLSAKPATYSLARKEQEEELELRVAAKPPRPQDALAVAIARGEVLID